MKKNYIEPVITIEDVMMEDVLAVSFVEEAQDIFDWDIVL